MKKLLLLLLLCFPLVVLAQDYVPDTTKIEAVTLKNGHIIRGKIVEYKPLESLKIQQSNGIVTQVTWDQIVVIKKEKQQPKSAFTTTFGEDKGPRKGFRAMVDAGYGFFVGNNRTTDLISSYCDHFEVNAVAGYQLYPFLFLGAGAGYHGYKKDINGKQFAMIPIFGDVRVDFLRSGFTPFVDFRMGYSIGDGPYRRDDGHMFMCPAIGGRFALNNRLALNIKFGVTLQKVAFGGMAAQGNEFMRTLTILGGIEF